MNIKISFIVVLLSCCGALIAQNTVVVTNNSSLKRVGELVEVPYTKTKSFVITNSRGDEISYQLVFDKSGKQKGFVFQADVDVRSKSAYKIKAGKPSAVKVLSSGRFVPERKDDFAWENDFAAYRMYGSALAKENPSNGVDYWAKRTTGLVVDSFYVGELQRKQSYHRDRGFGMDFYKVGHTLGCGGVSLYVNDSLWVGDHFDTYKVIESGPLRTVFTLSYDSVKVGKDIYKEVITITSEAGSLLNKAVVAYIGKVQDMKIAAGVFLHDGKGVLKQDKGVLTYAENAVSEFKDPSGRTYAAVVVPTIPVSFKKNTIHAFLLSNYKSSQKLSYYFGGGWNKWKFPTDEDWANAVDAFKQKKEKPLAVIIK